MSMETESNTQPTSGRSYVVTLLLSIFLGPFGIHRFYTGYVGIGIAQILTSWCGIGALWACIDVISIALNKYKDVDGNELVNYNPGCGLIALAFLVVSFVIGGFLSVMSMLSAISFGN